LNLSSAPESSQQDLLQEISAIENLVSLPEVYLKLRKAINDLASDMDDFTSIISMDVNLSATLLRIVNSAFYGFPGKIQNISRAIHLLGIGQVHEIALSVCAISSLQLPNDVCPLKDFWRRSLLAGNIARQLAQAKKLPLSERVFVAGLLHDIGHMVLYAVFPELSKALLQQYQAGTERLDIIEKQHLDMHYGDIGAFIMQCWGLPEFYHCVTQYHPAPAAASQFPLETALVHLSHGYAWADCEGADSAVEKFLDPVVWQMAELAVDDMPEFIDEAKSTTADMEKTLLADIK